VDPGDAGAFGFSGVRVAPGGTRRKTGAEGAGPTLKVGVLGGAVADATCAEAKTEVAKRKEAEIATVRIFVVMFHKSRLRRTFR
jgi:hypothetical protein